MKHLIEEFKKLSTPTVSDALDKLGIKGGCHGITPIVLGKKIVGPAFTVKYIPVGDDKAIAGDFIDDVQEGDVAVLDNNGRTDCTVWGDIMTFVAVNRKIAGTVIDGVCRDVDGIRELGYPIFTRGHYMVTGKDRVTVQAVNQPVSISGIRVRPKDIVMADESGVLIIPSHRAEEVLATALEIHRAEQSIEEAIKSGSSLVDARKKFKYDELQRKQS